MPQIVVEFPPIDVNPNVEVPPIDSPDVEFPSPFECNTFTQEGCTGGEFCNAVHVCQARFGNNHACLADQECSSGICSAGLCAECTRQRDCSSNEWCDAFGDCRSKWNNGHTCLSNVECKSGDCCFGFCCG